MEPIVPDACSPATARATSCTPRCTKPVSRISLSPATATTASNSIGPTSPPPAAAPLRRSEEHTSELQSRLHLVCRLLLEKKKISIHYRPPRPLSRRIRCERSSKALDPLLAHGLRASTPGEPRPDLRDFWPVGIRPVTQNV